MGRDDEEPHEAKQMKPNGLLSSDRPSTPVEPAPTLQKGVVHWDGSDSENEEVARHPPPRRQMLQRMRTTEVARAGAQGRFSRFAHAFGEAEDGADAWYSEFEDHLKKLPKNPVFINVEEMKEKVRSNLYRPPYNVCDCYKESGICQAIARSSVFEHITLFVIAFNALWVWIDADGNDADTLLTAETQFIVAENLFCSFFGFEWIVRFMSFRRKRDGLQDFWFVFDSMMVILMVSETWVLTIVVACMRGDVASPTAAVDTSALFSMMKLLRMARMARMARLLNTCPELMILIKGMVSAFRSVLYTLLLQVVVLYIFGIVFKIAAANTQVGKEYFYSVLASMYTLLIYGTLLDNVAEVVTQIGDESWGLATIFWVFVLLSSLTVMNMLIGVLCEVVSAVSASENEANMVSFVINKVRAFMNAADENQDWQISKREFISILENKDATVCLQEAGIDAVSLIDSVDAIFEEEFEADGSEKTIDFQVFMESILSLRGTNTASVKDIVNLRKVVRNIAKEQAEAMSELKENLLLLTHSVNPALGERLAARRSTEPKLKGTTSKAQKDSSSLRETARTLTRDMSFDSVKSMKPTDSLACFNIAETRTTTEETANEQKKEYQKRHAHRPHCLRKGPQAPELPDLKPQEESAGRSRRPGSEDSVRTTQRPHSAWRRNRPQSRGGRRSEDLETLTAKLEETMTYKLAEIECLLGNLLRQVQTTPSQSRSRDNALPGMVQSSEDEAAAGVNGEMASGLDDLRGSEPQIKVEEQRALAFRSVEALCGISALQKLQDMLPSDKVKTGLIDTLV